MADFVIASAVAILFAVPVVAIAILVRLSMGSPVLFGQLRLGLGEKPFTCWKFRSMNNATDASGKLLPDACRITRVGRFLRRTSLDELPQLWNIFRGELSFVGPRPLFASYLPYYSQSERRRHSVRPGLTGWAQVHGRNCLSFDERLRLDVWYVDHVSWRLDVQIVWKTIWIVLRQEGYAADLAPLNEIRRSQRNEEEGPLTYASLHKSADK